MTKRRDLTTMVYEYFEIADLDTAATVLKTCQWILARRQPPPAVPPTGRRKKPTTDRTQPVPPTDEARRTT